MSQATAPAAATTGRPATWTSIGSWDDVGAAVRVAALPIAVWLGLTLLLSFTLTDAARSAIERSSSLGSIGNGFANQFLSAGTGAIGALLAGLGYQVGAGGTAGALGTATNVDVGFGLGLVPLSTLTVFTLLMARGSRAAAAKRGGTRLQDFVVPALLAAAGTSLAMYLVSLFLSAALGGFLSGQDGVGINVTVRGGPTFSGLLFVLFPVLAVGSVAGAMTAGGWPLLRQRLAPQLSTPSSARVLARAPLLLYAAAGYLVVIFVGSIVAFALLVMYAIANGADIVDMLRLLPATILLMPNALAELILAGTGAQIGVATTGLASNTAPQVGSLWDASLEWVLAGILALVAPGLIAGILARRGMPSATPGTVAVVGGLTGLIAVIVAIVAMPSFSGTGTVFVSGGSAGTKLIFDLGHVVVVGGTVMVVSALAGFLFGGGVAGKVPDVASWFRMGGDRNG